MATIRQKKAFKQIIENHGNTKSVSRVMREVGYDDTTAQNPSNLTNSKGWQELINIHLSDDALSKRHAELLNSHRLEHMTFPPFVSKDAENDEDIPELEDELEEGEEETNHGKKFGRQLTDKDIREMLLSVNCRVKKIVHGELMRHVYFWSPDNKARKDALDMAYQLKGLYAPKKTLHGHINLDEEASKKAKKAREQVFLN